MHFLVYWLHDGGKPDAIFVMGHKNVVLFLARNGHVYDLTGVAAAALWTVSGRHVLPQMASKAFQAAHAQRMPGHISSLHLTNLQRAADPQILACLAAQ